MIEKKYYLYVDWGRCLTRRIPVLVEGLQWRKSANESSSICKYNPNSQVLWTSLSNLMITFKPFTRQDLQFVAKYTNGSTLPGSRRSNQWKDSTRSRLTQPIPNLSMFHRSLQRMPWNLICIVIASQGSQLWPLYNVPRIVSLNACEGHSMS